MSITDKIPIMNEWYSQVHAHMLEEAVTRDNIAGSVSSCETIRIRHGMDDLIRHCQEANPVIPVLIMSAGLGEVIEEFLRQKLPFPIAPTTHVVSNRMVFDDSGSLKNFSEPLLHMFNKTAAFLPDSSKSLAEGKRHCLLMGDGLGDLTMAQGLDVETLKVGFLNEKVRERFDDFIEGFDIVVTDDGPVPEIALRAIGAPPEKPSRSQTLS
eukprot:TRINITY_DN94025_c0_g1_i1.p1 TRINITY_DN94025_c0_g1~~TRINITY_DN94025_c0_g1_i1.p1  ORF type:complete len:241 (+),score=36.38 TRINITY_DN94025_c0_g1_i1:91-723(+)